MSADSMNTVASAPYPTTPTDLSSTEMDRFGNAWALLDDNVKAKQELFELDHPWKQMEIGRREPGEPQEYFCQMHNRFKEVLISRPHLETLKHSMGLAHRLVFSHCGLKVANYFQSSHDTKQRISDLSRAHPWTIVFQDRVPGGQFARYNQDTPGEIILDFQVIDRASRAGHLAEQNPTYENNMIYTRYLFMIGVILGRIFFQSLTDILNNQLTWKSRSGGSVPAPRDWEHEILGGHLVGCSKVDSTSPILDSLVIQVKAVTDGWTMHYTASDMDISDIVWKCGDWEALLPLTPDEAGVHKGRPENMTFKMKGIDRTGATLCFKQGYLMRVIPASDQSQGTIPAPPSPKLVRSASSF